MDCATELNDGDNDDGGAKATTVPNFSRQMGLMIVGATGYPQPPSATPLMQRFLREVGAKKSDGSSYDTDYFPIPTQNNDDDDAEGISKQE